jgi:hypothetical protein
MKMSSPALKNRCLDGKKIWSPPLDRCAYNWWEWVYMMALAVQSILAQSSGLKNSLKRQQKRAKLLRHTARGGKSAVKLGLAKKANSYHLIIDQ